MVSSVASCRSIAASGVTWRRPSAVLVIHPLACSVATFLHTVSLGMPVNSATDWMLIGLWPPSASFFRVI